MSKPSEFFLGSLALLSESLLDILAFLLDLLPSQILFGVDQIVPQLAAVGNVGALDQGCLTESVWVLNLSHTVI